MPFLIVPLLAFSVPLFIGATYQHGRIRGAAIGGAWLLLALFLAGMNFGTGVLLAFTYPYYSAAVFAAVAGILFFAGPSSALWKQVASLRSVRIAAIGVRRAFHRRGLSRRLAGDAVAMTAALLILSPVSFLTLKPDPAYEYAIGKLQRELSLRLPDSGKLAEAAAAATLEQHKAEPGFRDAEAAMAADRDIAAGETRVLSLIAGIKAPQERIDAARAEVTKIANASRTKLPDEMERASRLASVYALKLVLEEERSGIAETIRGAIEAAVPGIVERARHAMARMPVDGLRAVTERSVEPAAAEIDKAGRDAATTYLKRLLEERRARIEEVGRKAARGSAEESARAANAGMARIADQLRSALAAEEARRLEQEKKRQDDAARAKEQEEASRRFQEQVEQSRIAAARVRTEVLGRFHILPRTSFAGGQSLGPVTVRSVFECAVACLEAGCEAFAFQESASPMRACYRYKGRGATVLENHPYYTGGRLR
jgi:hypothetical protein